MNIKESQNDSLLVEVLFLLYHISILTSSKLSTFSRVDASIVLRSLIAILHCIRFLRA